VSNLIYLYIFAQTKTILYIKHYRG